MNLNTESNYQETEYLYMHNDIMGACHIVTDKGDISFTATDKIVLLLIVRNLGMWNSGSNIAKNCAISLRQASRVIKKLVDCRVLDAINPTGKRWEYRGVLPFTVKTLDGEKSNITQSHFIV